MLPHTMTIYNRYAERYYKKVLEGVYWYGTDSVNLSGKSIVESDSINIIITGENLKMYVPENEYIGSKNTYTLQKGNVILLGKGPDIESLNDIPENFKRMTVLGFDENIVSSNIDNILVIGK